MLGSKVAPGLRSRLEFSMHRPSTSYSALSITLPIEGQARTYLWSLGRSETDTQWRGAPSGGACCSQLLQLLSSTVPGKLRDVYPHLFVVVESATEQDHGHLLSYLGEKGSISNMLLYILSPVAYSPVFDIAGVPHCTERQIQKIQSSAITETI
jgi:hypothetical protein